MSERTIERMSGLDDLFGQPSENVTQGSALPISQIVLPASQPRRYFDQEKLEELSRSIKEFGILEPLLVRSLDGANYELVAGERRLKASQLAGLTEVPVVIREMDDAMTHKVRLVENLQREDLNPLEETQGILELLALQLDFTQNEVISYLTKMRHACERNTELGHNVMSQPETQMIEELFNTLGRMSWESFVKNRLPLLNLPSDVLSVLQEGKIEYTKARAIASVKDEEQRANLLSVAVSQNLSLTKIKELIKQLPSALTSAKTNPREVFNTRYSNIGKQLAQAKVWEDSKKSKRLEKLLSELEKLFDESNTNDR